MAVAYVMGLALPWVSRQWIYLFSSEFLPSSLPNPFALSLPSFPAIDGTCCADVLSAEGLCCPYGAIDDCGVCGGDNACHVHLQLEVCLAAPHDIPSLVASPSPSPFPLPDDCPGSLSNWTDDTLLLSSAGTSMANSLQTAVGKPRPLFASDVSALVVRPFAVQHPAQQPAPLRVARSDYQNLWLGSSWREVESVVCTIMDFQVLNGGVSDEELTYAVTDGFLQQPIQLSPYAFNRFNSFDPEEPLPCEFENGGVLDTMVVGSSLLSLQREGGKLVLSLRPFI